MSNAIAQELKRRRAIVPVLVNDRFEYYNEHGACLDEVREAAVWSAASDFPGAHVRAAGEKEVRWVS